MTTDASTELWTWQPRLTEGDLAKVRRSTFLGVATVLVLVIASAIRPSRALVVVTILVVISAASAWWQHRTLMSTRVSVSADGRLGISDSRSSTVVDAATVESIELRLRSTSSEGLTAISRWTIAIVTLEGAVTHRLGHLAGFWNLDQASITQFETELRSVTEPFRTRSARPSGPSTIGDPVDGRRDVVGDVPASGRYEWHPSISPRAERNLWLVRIGFFLPALAIAVIGVAQEWDGSLGDKVLTGATVPGFLVLCGVLTETVLKRNRRFAIVVEQGLLTVQRPWRSPTSIELAEASVDIDLRRHTAATADGTSSTVRWYLTVERPDGTKLLQQFPSLGVITTEADILVLERELERRS